MKKKDEILAITSFPPRGKVHGEQVVGIASYAKNTLYAIQNAENNHDQKQKFELTVLAEKLDAKESYREHGIDIKRIWERNSFSTFFKLIAEIFKNHKNAKIILLEFELSMFGNLLFLLPFPVFLLALKLLNKKIVFVLHQVIPDIEEVAPHMNIEHESLKIDLLNFALKIFYTLILFVSSKVIVFEEDLKEKLSEGCFMFNKKKVAVIPHGVENFKKIPTKNEAREKLGINKKSFVVLSFGFLAWYKGTDWIIHAVNAIKRKKKLSPGEIQLVLAGGANPNHENKDYYKRYIKGIGKACKKDGFMLTGFVPEKDIPLYFAACDLVVLPYRTFMSSSGPLSIAFSFKKPFLLSPKLRGLLESGDIKNLLAEAKLREKDIIFDNFNGDFENKLLKLIRNRRLRTRVKKFSGEAKKVRSWEMIGKLYYEELIN